MHTANVLGKILLPREAGTRATLAVVEGAEERLFGSTMHLVNFAFVAQEPSTVGEALKLFAAFYETLVGPIMLVHMFAPFAFAIEYYSCTILVIAHQLSLWVPWWLFGTLEGVILAE